MAVTKLREKPYFRLLLLLSIFLAAFFIPFNQPRVTGAISEAFLMLQEYTREHVLLCLVPAFFIAGAITVFLNQQAVITYLGPKARKPVAYSVAAVSGTVLSVCSCTVLPLFKGIYKKGAGLGPAIAFLYSGPAISVLAVVLTAKVLGPALGLARVIGAVLFSILIGYLMHLIFRYEDERRITDETLFQADQASGRPLWQNAVHLFSMTGILVFINWAPSGGTLPVWDLVHRAKYFITFGFAATLSFSLVRWFKKEELSAWLTASRDFALQILPLLFGGVLVAGFLLGRPGHPALLPEAWIAVWLGNNSVWANLLASLSGALMYFATLTEVPIIQGLMGAGMAQGPALALLLAGPSLSLPSVLVIGAELGVKKTLVYVVLVVLLSTLAGLLFGMLS